MKSFFIFNIGMLLSLFLYAGYEPEQELTIPQILQLPENGRAKNTIDAATLSDEPARDFILEFNRPAPSDPIYSTSLNQEMLKKSANAFIQLQKTIQKYSQLIGTPPQHTDSNTYFTQKIVLLEAAYSIIRGDLHGDMHSLAQFIQFYVENGVLNPQNPFKIVDKNAYFFFLGDYVDRGAYGPEVFFTILQFKLQNPGHVFLVRGNHEHPNRNYGRGGFYTQLKNRFFQNYERPSFYPDSTEINPDPILKRYFMPGAKPKQIKDRINEYNFRMIDQEIIRLQRVYNYLPVALFVGNEKEANKIDYFLACHGGIDIGYNPHELLSQPHKRVFHFPGNMWLDENRFQGFLKHAQLLNVEDYIQKGFKELIKLDMNGFQWTDFDLLNEFPNRKLTYQAFRGFMLSKEISKAWLKFSASEGNRTISHDGPHYQIVGVFRAHQHNLKTVPIIFESLIHRLGGDGANPQLDTLVAFLPHSVFMLNVAPRTGYYEKCFEDPREFNEDRVAKLIMKPEFENWELKVDRIPVFP